MNTILRHTTISLSLATLVALGACAGEEGELELDDPELGLDMNAPAPGEGEGEGEGAEEGGEPEPGDGDGDPAPGDGDGEPAPAPLEPCAAVDVLFVVDNSETMAEEQAKLLASAASFIDDSASLLGPEVSFQVGVITTDSAELVRASSAGEPCPFTVGEEGGEVPGPFIAHAGAMSPALDAGLSCALDVGTAGSPDERPVEMALAALGPGATQPEGPNSGFRRDEAALVVVVLSDEEDDLEAVTQWGSAGDPEDWANELSDLVYGVDERVVVATLVGHDKPNACPGYQWDGSEGAELAPRLAEFALSFAHGRVGDVCATSYAGFFAEVALDLADACTA